MRLLADLGKLGLQGVVQLLGRPINTSEVDTRASRTKNASFYESSPGG